MPRCSANRSDGQPCRGNAIRGGTVCTAHGGLAPQVKAAAKRRLVELAVRRRLAEVDVVPIGDPFTALEELASEAMGLRGLLAERVAALEELPESKPAEVRAHWKAYGDALDRAERFVRDLAALGLDERRVAISERLGAQVEAVLRGTLTAVFAVLRERLPSPAVAVLDVVERDEAPGIVRAELLRAVGGDDG